MSSSSYAWVVSIINWTVKKTYEISLGLQSKVSNIQKN